MIGLLLIPVLCIGYAYILWHLLRWLGACCDLFRKKTVKVVITIMGLLAGFSHLIAFFLPVSGTRRTMQLISNYWLGVMLYTLGTLAVTDVIRLLLKRCPAAKKGKLFSRKGLIAGGAVCLAVIVGFCTAGIIGAHRIQTTDYEVTIDKEAGGLDSLKIALVADLHMGYSIGCAHMESMVEKINAMQPDLIVIAGDIFDNEYEALEDPERLAEILKSLQSTYGTYAVYGNHDISEKILMGFTFDWKKKKENDPRMDAFLEAADIRLLKDEGVLIDNAFYVYGRPDYSRPGTEANDRYTPEELMKTMDSEKPVIVIDHQPVELEELAIVGVDLDLCGHTHDGQLFPVNLINKLKWKENPYGYLKKGNMHNIVTSGVGVFGPNMRVGTKSEICSIMVHFE